MLGNRIRSVWSLAVLLLAVWAAWTWGLQFGRDYACPVLLSPPFGAWVGPYIGKQLTDGCYDIANWIVGMVLIAVPIIWLGRGISSVFTKDAEGSTSPFIRRIIGLFWTAPIETFGLLLFGVLSIRAVNFIVEWGVKRGEEEPSSGAKIWMAILILGLFLEFVGIPTFYWTRAILGKGTRPIRRLWRAGHMGRGGSAKFAGLLEEWCHPWRGKGIFIGRSIYDPSWRIGLEDDRHTLTVAAARHGKGRCCIIPNLLLWKHSALVIDPKGTNAVVTAATRGNGGGRVKHGMGQKVYCINPFRVNEGVPGMPPSSRFNPLSDIDPADPRIVEDLGLIADGLIVPYGKKSYWDSNAKALLMCLMGHAITTDRENATLVTIYRMLAEVNKENSPLIEAMVNNPAISGMVQSLASEFANMNPKGRSDVATTAGDHIRWVMSVPMQEAMAASDFKFSDLKDAPTTVYLIVPSDLLEEHGRYLRLFTNLAVKAASRGTRSKTPILFILDEFYSLGAMTSLSSAAGLLAGYNIKLWPIVQNIGQLVERYPQNWETYVGNTGQIQAFGLVDTQTAGYFSGLLGRTMIYQDDPRTGKRVPAGVVDLRDYTEVSRMTGRRNKSQQIVYRAGEDPMLLYLEGYDTMFEAKQYNHDPDIPRGRLWKLVNVVPVWGWRKMVLGYETVRALVVLIKAAWYNFFNDRRM